MSVNADVKNDLNYEDTVFIRDTLLDRVNSLRSDLNVYKDTTQLMSLATSVQYEIDKYEAIHLKLMHLAHELYQK